MNIKSIKVSMLLCASFTSISCSARSGDNLANENQAVGSELQICENCPVFVRVPDAPDKFRAIRYVAKFELTWNKYLASYDAGACEIPNPNSGASKAGSNDILPHVDLYRIDWPMGQMGPAEVDCYVNWLQKKTPYVVALPTENEWEWFARAGEQNAKYPWGNAPDPSKEALKGAVISKKDELPYTYSEGGKHLDRHLTGVRVGLFPPNSWGLHDIMGNAIELTENIISGKDYSALQSNSQYARNTQNREKVVVKGSTRWNAKWFEKGISGRSFTTIWDGRYTAEVALRLVLIKKGVE